MIPPFDENGYLPPGIHSATLEEVTARFGEESEIRRAEMDSVRWMVDLARQAAVERVVLNGSFATAAEEPNDVDCVLLLGPDTRRDSEAYAALEEGLPFLSILLAEKADFDELVDVFASDRQEVPKGMIEVIA